MKDIFYYELRKRVEEIRQIEATNSSEEKYHLTPQGQMLIDTVDQIISLAWIARKEGLLALEEAICEMDDTDGKKYLKHLAMLAVDGTDPDIVEEIAFGRYFTSKLTDYAALQYLMMIYGVRSIQNRENPHILGNKMINILPEEIMEEYIRIREEKSAQKDSRPRGVKEVDLDMSLVNKYCEEDGLAELEPGDDYYYVIKMLDDLFITTDDRGIQRLLFDVENQDLTLAMKAISGQAKAAIFRCMSKRLSVMIAEDLEILGSVKLSDAGIACKKVFMVFLKLIEAGEIVFDEDTMIREMATVFLFRQDPSSSSQIRESENKLYTLWREYLSHTNKMLG